MNRILQTQVWCIDKRLQDITGNTDHEWRNFAIDLDKVTCIQERSSEDDDPDIVPDKITIIYAVNESFIANILFSDMLLIWEDKKLPSLL